MTQLIRLGISQKILLTACCFAVAIVAFIAKLPAAFRGFDRELHSAFYFCASAFLTILFARRSLIIQLLIAGFLYVFGMAIELGQVFSKKHFRIPHGRYDPEDVKANLAGILVFSLLWMIYLLISYLVRGKKRLESRGSHPLPGTESSRAAKY